MEFIEMQHALVMSLIEFFGSGPLSLDNRVIFIYVVYRILKFLKNIFEIYLLLQFLSHRLKMNRILLILAV